MEETGLSRKWWVVIVLGLGTSIGYIDRVILSVAMPTMMKVFHINGTEAGLLLSAFFWSYTILQVPSGWLIDRFGSRLVLAIAYVFWSLSSAATGLVSSFRGLLACRICLGIGESPAYPTGYRLAATLFTERGRGLASAIWSEGSKLGPVIGAPLAAFLLTYYGWRILFLITGLASLVWVIPWLVFAPRSDPPDAVKARAQARLSWRIFLQKRETWGFILGFFGFLYVFYVYLTWFPGYLMLARNFGVMKSGSLASLSYLVQSLAGLFGGWMADRLIHSGHSTTSVRKSFIGGGLGLGLAIVPAALVTSDWQAVGLFMVSMAGMGVAVSNMLAVPAGLAPKGMGGTIGGLHSMAGNLGGVVAPVVTGAIYASSKSFVLALMVAGGMLVVSGIGYLVIIRRIEPMEIMVPIAKELPIAKEEAGCH